MSRSTWNASQNTDWNSPDNWTPAGAPTGTALFETAPGTNIGFIAESETEVESIEFSDQADVFSFTFNTSDKPALTLSGKGVVNNSAKPQHFTVASVSSGFSNPQLRFVNNACAGGEDIYFCVGPESKQGYGGGVICFHDSANAGNAFFKVWTGAGTPPHHSTVGGEVSFCDNASAASARFSIYGSLGVDGDTFGNVVFHNNATAANATFDNVGGTVSGGDGGNTQFYGSSSAANGIYNNRGGSHSKANGGDVAFDATATGGRGQFYDHAAPAEGAYGGVTSFNNNPPSMPQDQGASADNGSYFNYGASGDQKGGGGHLAFSARYGSPTAAQAKIVNYGSAISAKSSAGHTLFSINLPTVYFPTAGSATIWNHPGETAEGAGGYTEFSIYGDGSAPVGRVPTAGQATIFNLGAYLSGASGGYTVFSGNTCAGSATLVAYGGEKGGYGGRIVFYDQSTADNASVQLVGNGELDISYHQAALTIKQLELNGGKIRVKPVGDEAVLNITEVLNCKNRAVIELVADKNKSLACGVTYKLIQADFTHCSVDQFECAPIEGMDVALAITGNSLEVRLTKTASSV